MSKRADAVIVAAGSGTRSGLNIPKQFYMLGEKPVLAHTIEAFLGVDDINTVVVVLPEENFDSHKEYMEGFCRQEGVKYVSGGSTRLLSVFNGLNVLNSIGASRIVCIHDGVRPFVTAKIITDSIDCAEKHIAALTAIPITDTVKQVKNGVVEKTLDRSVLFAAQTPQTFNFDAIFAAYKKAMDDNMSFTDDCAVAEYSGISITITYGSTKNVKLTVPEDFEDLK
ncbi:MAG: 2-C-methyl-D-erythritol 4-phosphate cytidylyltransferase [Clostridiales bacterium]|nr:2-C-methyl-D-erythritol 4-phosphate cytidylyltransferase [Clostridiales bacterium]